MNVFLKKLHYPAKFHPLFYIFLIFLTVQFILYYKIGIYSDLEAKKYIIQGNILFETGKLSETKYIFYLPVILLVYLCRLLSVSYHLIVLVQSILSGLSLWCFYKLGTGIFNEKVAFYACILLALFVPLQSWNFYLYSDSIFISLTLIYTYVVYKNSFKGIKGTAVIVSFLILLFFCRPHGLLFIPPTIIYLLFRNQSRISFFAALLFCLGLSGVMYLLLNTAFTGGEDMDAMKPFLEEHVICFVPLKPEGAVLDFIKTNNPVNDIFYYIFHNPLHFLRLMLLKLSSFFNITRSYYSTWHNVFLSLFIFPIYIFGLAGLHYFIKPLKNFKIFLFSLLFLYPLGATFQCDDWHSRFTMVIFPYIVLLAVYGLYRIRTLRKKNHELL